MVRLEPAGPVIVTAPASRYVKLPPAEAVEPLLVDWITWQLPDWMMVGFAWAADANWNPLSWLKPPPMVSNFALPSEGTLIENCVIVKPPVVMVLPLSRLCNCAVVYPGITQALEPESGAMEIDVGALNLPFTEICRLTAQPVGMLEGKVKLIWSSPAYPSRPA